MRSMEHFQDPHGESEGSTEESTTTHGPFPSGPPLGPLGGPSLGPEMGSGIWLAHRHGNEFGSPMYLGDLGR
jgi:hypothetical protein